MTVKAILSRKGKDVVTILPTATLFEAVNILDAHRIGAVVIVGTDQRIQGILSERDIVRTLAHNIRAARLSALRRGRGKGDDARRRDLQAER